MTTNDPTLPYQSLPLEPPPDAPTPAPNQPHDPYAALRHVNYRRYYVGNAFTVIGMQMAGITVGWELYARTNSAVALGMVGLVQILPILFFALPAGHIVDRFNRRNIILVATALLALTYLSLGLSSRYADQFPNVGLLASVNHFLAAIAHLFGDPHPQFTNPHIPFMFLILFINGSIRAVNQPARQSIVTALVPKEHLSNAITWNSSLFETCNMIGPALAGIAIGLLLGKNNANPWAYPLIYWFTALCQVVQFVNISRIHIQRTDRPREPMTFQSLLAGVRFVKNNQIILSTITLDLFAVLLGGATALLPVFAKDILKVGPMGLGFLRAAPSVGAITMALMLAHLPPMKNAGRNMLVAVAGFGAATIVFGLSRNFWLSMAALVVTGFCDNISVVVRQTLVQLLTPDAMRGRVSAVNSVFISTSNEMGEFESGVTAALGIRITGSPIYGPMLAVAAGGVGTLLVVTGVAYLWPQVRTVKRLTHGGT
jgi:MFS family permease